MKISGRQKSCTSFSVIPPQWYYKKKFKVLKKALNFKVLPNGLQKAYTTFIQFYFYVRSFPQNFQNTTLLNFYRHGTSKYVKTETSGKLSIS